MDKRYTEFDEYAAKAGFDGLTIRKLVDLGFLKAPAAAKHHSNYEGGLYDHSIAVTRKLVEMTNLLHLKWSRPESPYIVGMLHDLCKCDEYRWDRENKCYQFVENTALKGHGDKSVLIISTFFKLTEEEMMCIRYHMGAFKTEDWSQYSAACHKYPNVLFTHTADMFASQVEGV